MRKFVALYRPEAALRICSQYLLATEMLIHVGYGQNPSGQNLREVGQNSRSENSNGSTYTIFKWQGRENKNS